MKAFFAIFALLLTTTSAQAQSPAACDDGLVEAQFQGRIVNLAYSQDSEAGNMPHTTFGLGKFTSYRENPACGLDIEIAAKASFWVQGSTILKENQAVSGILQYNPETRNYTLLGVPVVR